MEENREFENPFEDYEVHRGSDVVYVQEGIIRFQMVHKLQNSVGKLRATLDASLEKQSDPNDSTIYTGTTGIVLLYYLIAQKQNNPALLQRALKMVEKILPTLHGRTLTFLNGDCGPLALAAVLFHKNGNSSRSTELIHRLTSYVPFIVDMKSNLPDELLYGRAGYLHALLFVNKHLDKEVIDADTIRRVVTAILNSGKALAKSENKSAPLMYKWDGRCYIGAAHGISGILYMLLQARKYLTVTELDTLIRPTIDFLIGTRFPTWNFPSSLGSDDDERIHWCHGAPGMVYLFGLAYEVYGNKGYLKIAKECGEVVWKRGLLKKGHGICHGVAGNAYTFVYLYQLTDDTKHLHRALKFADWCTAYEEHKCRTPDHPISLFEGLAGTIYMMVDLQEPREAKFPSFNL